MEPIGLGLLVLGAAGSSLWAVRRERRQAKATKLRRDLHIADQRLASEYRQSRRAMNDAADQSWRNLTE